MSKYGLIILLYTFEMATNTKIDFLIVKKDST